MDEYNQIQNCWCDEKKCVKKKTQKRKQIFAMRRELPGIKTGTTRTFKNMSNTQYTHCINGYVLIRVTYTYSKKKKNMKKKRFNINILRLSVIFYFYFFFVFVICEKWLLKM